MSRDLDKTTNQSTQVAFMILEEMAPLGEGIRVTDLALRLGMPKPRIYRFLQTLTALGYVAQDPATERYHLTLKLFHLGQAIADGTQLTTVARPVMIRLRDATGQTTTLSVVEDRGMRVIDIVRMETPVQIVTKPGALLEFHASAQGKLALAFGKPALWDYVRTHPLAVLTRQTNTDIARLEREVQQVRRQGWAAAPEETLPGVNAVSAPILDAGNAMIGTITIAGSVQTILPEPEESQIAAVREAARSISNSLGCTEYPE
ncbi:transcriptional regulator, IclR family [Tistlia consotensis]|uniref:Transcriptional regulator, IclR family n=1 Tax=Tistlia consotensis USBA 355 TaxID=560819 RepID=A0A1Y6B8M7_9PROT|nr:IclR family transcriptional regulator [Tistlia consotensis]SME98658.1 transcriptional regulator, IclR family [Tistlia consotensis USBA 355]SNR58045.1 transcriptional regulator, IclR family [Tistlia consotensis]